MELDQTYPKATFKSYVSLLTICLSLFACDEQSEIDQQAEAYPNQEEAGVSADNSARDGERLGEGEAGTESFEANPSDFIDAGVGQAAGESAINNEMDEASSQTWQESQAAQRQPIVDVGGGNTLTLHSQRVSTRVEGHRARTIVDQVFYSPYERELVGTFRYSLPVGASVSHYALYLGRIQGDFDQLGDRVASTDPLAQAEPRDRLEMSTEELMQRIGEDEEAWGELRIGRIVSQADGREAFEDTTRQNVDPALVENTSPNAFQARVFPIQPHGYTRIVFAYDEPLARVEGSLVYTFPLPEDEIAHLSFELLVDEEASEGGDEQAELESPLLLTPLPARQMSDAPDEGEERAESAEEEGRAWSGRVDGEGLAVR